MSIEVNSIVESNHIITIKVSNSFNALSRIAGLFSGRGFNIDSISIGSSERPEIASCTITTHGDTRIVEQIARQLDKLVDVEEVKDLSDEPHVSRELALIKVSAPAELRSEIMQIANIFRSNIVDISPQTLTIELTGNRNKIDACISMLRPFGLREVARTGMIAMAREYQGEA